LGLDEAGLEQAHDEGAGAGEGVEDVDALVGDRGSELSLQSVVYLVEDEVHDLVGGVDDAEAVAGAAEGSAEELLVQLLDDALLRRAIGYTGGSGADGVVELLEPFGLLL